MESSDVNENVSNIKQFCAVTGAASDVAARVLEACNGNLEMAINMHVDSQVEEPQSTSNFQAGNSSTEDNVRPPIPPISGVLVEEKYHIGIPERRRPIRSVFDGFRDFQAEARWQEEELYNNKHISKKRKTLEDLFRPPLDLIHRGSFESAKEGGQTSNRWLLVNVQNTQEFPCQVLNRDVWSNPAVKDIVSEHFVFWQVYSDSEEGLRYMQFYKVIEFPYIAVLDPRTGETLAVWNKMDSALFCDLVTEFLTEHPSPEVSFQGAPKKNVKKESILDKTEEEQLKAAIVASLTDPSIPTSSKKATNSEAIGDDYFDSDSSSSESIHVDSSSEKTPCKTSLESEGARHNNKEAVEGDSSLPNNSCDSKSSTCSTNWKDFLGDENDPTSELILRFPDGGRKQLRLPSTSKIQALVLYVISEGYSEEEYELITTFPRRQLYNIERTLTLKEVGLYPQETVFVQLKS